MEGLPLLKHAMKEKVLMIAIDLKVLAFVCQWANSINPFLGSFLFFNSLLSTFSPYFIHKATEQQSLMGRRDVKYTVIQFDVRHIHLFRSALTLLNSEE